MTRIEWIDMAKGLGILAVILGHCHLPDKAWNAIYSWHLPIFFLISGYFYKKRSFLDLVKVKFNSILKPYFYTCIGIALIEGGKALLAHHSVWGAVRDWLLAGLYGSYFGVKFGFNFIGAIWFLPALFFTILLLHFSLKSRYPPSVILILALSGYFSAKWIGLPGSITQAMIALPYVYLGYIIKKYNLSGILVNKSAILPFLIIYCIGIVDGYGQIDINTAYYGKGIGDFFFSIVATLLFLTVSFLLQDYKILKQSLSFIGRNSLKILCFHNVECISFPFMELIKGIPILNHTRFIFPLRGAWAILCTIIMNYSKGIIKNKANKYHRLN